MTAQGKVNASKVQIGDRIIVKDHFDAEGHVVIHESRTKTGEGVHIARVTGKAKVSNARGYMILTSAGDFYAEPIQTMWLAPEDNASTRAHAEALVEATARRSAERNAAEAARQAELDEQRWTNGAIVDVEVEAHRENAEVCQDCELSETTGEHAADSWSAHPFRAPAADETPAATPIGQVRDDLRADGFEIMGKTDQQLRDMHADEKLRAVRRGEIIPATTFLEDAEAEAAQRTETATRTDGHHLAQTEDRKSRTGGDVVRLLEKVWTRIREDHPELPDVVIITGSGMVGGSKWGHFRPDGWTGKGEFVPEANDHSRIRRHELFLAGEALAKGSAQVLQTMLHEGAHTLARVRDVKDTSRQGRWHNQQFRKLAEEMGLEHKGEQGDKTRGFSFVTLTEETRARYAGLLAELDTQIGLTCHLPGWLGGEGEESEGGEKITGKPVGGSDSKPRDIKTTCGCDEPLSIRLTRKALERGTVKCGECDQLFTEAE